MSGTRSAPGIAVGAASSLELAREGRLTRPAPGEPPPAARAVLHSQSPARTAPARRPWNLARAPVFCGLGLGLGLGLSGLWLRLGLSGLWLPLGPRRPQTPAPARPPVGSGSGSGSAARGLCTGSAGLRLRLGLGRLLSALSAACPPAVRRGRAPALGASSAPSGAGVSSRLLALLVGPIPMSSMVAVAGGVRVVGPGVHLQLGQLLRPGGCGASSPGTALRMISSGRRASISSNVRTFSPPGTGVAVVALVARLLPYPDLLRVDDDDEVADVAVRGVHGLALPAQRVGDLRRSRPSVWPAASTTSSCAGGRRAGDVRSSSTGVSRIPAPRRGRAARTRKTARDRAARP